MQAESPHDAEAQVTLGRELRSAELQSETGQGSQTEFTGPAGSAWWTLGGLGCSSQGHVLLMPSPRSRHRQGYQHGMQIPRGPRLCQNPDAGQQGTAELCEAACLEN